MWRREGHEGNPGTHEVTERSWAGLIILKTTRMFENSEVTRKDTYNIKQDSNHWALLTRWSNCEKEVSTWVSQPLPSALNVLDALIQPKDSHSSKSRCPELSLPTPGWRMWIICVFSEMNTWCCELKQANIVVLSEVTQTWKVLPKTITMRGCTGEINPNYGQTSLFLSTFKKTFPFTSIFLTIQVSYTFTYALSYRRQKLRLTETKAEHREKVKLQVACSVWKTGLN